MFTAWWYFVTLGEDADGGLVRASLMVANLLAHMNYSFRIEAVNGVSDLSPEPRRAAVVNITTNQAGRRRGSVPQLPRPLVLVGSECCHGLAVAFRARACLSLPCLPPQHSELQALQALRRGQHVL